MESRQLLAAVAFSPQVLIDDLDADGPDRVVAADVDGDGDVDAVIGSWRDSRIAWYENSGLGDFTRHAIANDASEVRDLVVADFDGDGDADIAVAAYGSDSIRWYQNIDGQGTFDASIVITRQADGVRSLSAVDIDLDGHTDLVSGSWFDGKVAWYKNDGQGRFGLQQIITSETQGPRSLQTGDINGDGRPDVVVASRLDDSISWFPNLGGGLFGSRTSLDFTGNGPESIQLGDADNDGDLDLFVAFYWEGSIAWFENTDAAGNFGPLQSVSTNAERGQVVAVADLDGDGDQDLLSGSYYDLQNKLAWYRNMDGQGDFGSEQIVSFDVIGITDVVVADVDKDGAPDLLTASGIDNKASWFRNRDGAGNFDRPRQIVSDAGGAASTGIVDVDGDGDLDVLSASYWDNKIGWYENLDSAGTFSPQRVISNDAQRAQAVRWADLNGDQNIDVLSASSADGKIAWYENLGQGNFGKQSIITNRILGAVHVHAEDLDNDGDMDVVSASAGDGIVAWYENLDGQGDFGDIRILTRRAIEVEWIATSDMDGDGDPDILSASYGDGWISWFENLDGQGDFSSKQNIIQGAGPTTVEPFDLDQDGDLDLISTFYQSSTLVWIENLGEMAFADAETLVVGLMRPEALHLADIDGNGIDDVIAGGDRSVIWLERSLEGSVTLHTVTTDVQQVFDVVAGDVTGDGRIDVVSASFFDSKIALYRNESAQGDLDGDGNVDAADIDRLCEALRSQDQDGLFDLSGDGLVSFEDMDVLIKNLLGTTFGDSDLDGVFNSQDLVAILQAGEYEDVELGNSTWAEGDWNCDGDFDSQDLVLALQEGGYSINSIGIQPAVITMEDSSSGASVTRRVSISDWASAIAARDSLKLKRQSFMP